MNIELIQADAIEGMSRYPDKFFQCCVTSVPYYHLRDYGVDGQIGLEDTPEEYIQKLVLVFREAWRVLKDDGTLWLNVGDSYASRPQRNDEKYTNNINSRGNTNRCRVIEIDRSKRTSKRFGGGNVACTGDLKPKDMIGIPWMLAFALRADGWYLRSDIIWNKPNPMPESVKDRPTKSHEYLFLLSKSERYYYDAEAIKEPCKWSTMERLSQNIEKQKGSERGFGGKKTNGTMKAVGGKGMNTSMAGGAIGIENRKHLPYPGANKRTVWTVATRPFKEAHFATYPPQLVAPCILAGTSEKGQCPHCGKAWVREIQRGSLVSVDGTRSDYSPKKGTVDTKIKGRSDGGVPNHVYEKSTNGWVPTCNCDGNIPVPQSVLDMFNGAGTTGVVCKELHRDYVGIDLKGEYIELSKKRIADVQESFLFESI